MNEMSRCPICHGQTFRKKTTTKDYTVSAETFHIIQCNQCSLGITTPRPDDKTLLTYYLSDEYISHSGKSNSIIDSLYLFARNYTLSWKHQIISKLTSARRMLDYGCGTGEFLKFMQNKEYQVEGVEPSELARGKASALLTQPIKSSLDNATGPYDIITLWHVLEHVPDLNQKLEALSEKLAADGVIVIAVPNINSWESTYYNEFWAAFDTPRHLWHFSRKSMETLLQKNHLKLVDTIPMKLDAFYISLLSEKYKNQNKQNFIGMIRAFFVGLSSNTKAAKSGEYSSLIYIAAHEK
jgi:2-polyprenyl-3-methyl-5-hydroxy-6-metoxy-1,4-benzoquinol methylase